MNVQETLIDKIIISALFIILIIALAFAPDVFRNDGQVKPQQKEHHGK